MAYKDKNVMFALFQESLLKKSREIGNKEKIKK
jgi:hypothetical protein